MQSKSAHCVEPVETRADPCHAELTKLADALMQHARETSLTLDEEEQVLMDVESDGMRCILVRTKAQRETPPHLSPREQEIARMIARGLPNKTIAAVLEISSWTVGTYLRRMFAKLNVTSRAAMVAKLREHVRP